MQEAFVCVYYTKDDALRIVLANDYPRVWMNQGARGEWNLQLLQASDVDKTFSIHRAVVYTDEGPVLHDL